MVGWGKSKRIQVVSMGLGMALLLMGSLPVAAKEKPEPVPQWALDAARTPTPAYAKDSPAVVLFDEYLITVDEQNHAVERERFAVRILKPQGRRHSHCMVAYDIGQKLHYFHSWTIAADGKQLQAMDADFADYGAYDSPVLQSTERIRTVNPPGSDPGAVVTCETEEQLQPYMNEEEWGIQSNVPFVSEALELVLPPGGHYADSWRKHAPIKPIEVGPNHLRWEIKDMPALDLENMHAVPDWGALAARMSVKWGDMAVTGVDNQWRALGQWEEKLEEHRADPTPEIAAKTQELVAGATDFYTKLARITDYIQKNVRYFVVEKGIGGLQAHYAGDVYRYRYGDCKDKATLLIAMLHTIGVRAYYLHVDTRRGFIDPEEPSLWGNHMITAIELPEGENDPRLLARVKAANGKTLLIFDPTDEVTPAGLIREELQGAYGNVANGLDSQVLRMPLLSPDAAGRKRKGTFTLAGDGTISGEIAEEFLGDEARRERHFIKENDSRELREKLEKSVAAELPGLGFKDFAFSGTADLDKPLELKLNLSATGYAHSAGPLLLLRPHVLGSHAPRVADVMEGKPRLYPIELGHPGRWRDSFDIALPEGYVVDEMPDPVNIDLDFASYHSSLSAKGNLIHYENEYVVRDVEIPPSQADNLRKLANTILTDERGMAVLKKP